MTTHSAGIVLHRQADAGSDVATVEVMLVHPGGPFWAKKDDHAWSIPKGEFDPDHEDPEAAGRREFAEELGRPVPDGSTQALEPFKAGRKTIHAWLVAADFDVADITSNEIEIEWPPRSGRQLRIPEVDRAAWFTLEQARNKLHKGQMVLVDLVEVALSQ